jgi:hypothetical protein
MVSCPTPALSRGDPRLSHKQVMSSGRPPEAKGESIPFTGLVERRALGFIREPKIAGDHRRAFNRTRFSFRSGWANPRVDSQATAIKSNSARITS